MSWNRSAIDISQSAVKAILPSMDVVVSAPLNLNAALPTPALAGGQTVRSLRADGTNRAPKRGQQLCCHGCTCRFSRAWNVAAAATFEPRAEERASKTADAKRQRDQWLALGTGSSPKRQALAQTGAGANTGEPQARELVALWGQS